jgi:hypothetical protein
VTAAYADSAEHLADELRRLDLSIRLLAERPSEIDRLLPDDADPASELARLSAEIEARTGLAAEQGVALTLPRLGRLFGLSPLELRAIVVCLAPELQRKYHRLYAHLQDDPARRRPTVNLVLELLCETEADRWRARAVFSASAPLLRARLLEEAGGARSLRLDPRALEYVLGSPGVDPALAGRAVLHAPHAAGTAPVDAALRDGVRNLVERRLLAADADGRKLVVHLQGSDAASRRDLALHVTASIAMALLEVDLEALPAGEADAEELLRHAFREALLQQAAVHLEHADVLFEDRSRALVRALAVAIGEYGWLTFLGGDAPWPADDAFAAHRFVAVPIPAADVHARAAAWERRLAGRTARASEWAAHLAARYRLHPGRIDPAVELAENRRLLAGGDPSLTLSDLATACRQQAAHRLGSLAVKIEPARGWDEIVLPDDRMDHLRELCAQVRHRERVFGDWRFGGRSARGLGVSALFSGPPGTGKTLAAEVVAADLELDLYRVDLSGVVSKYIGETEKNLDRVFVEAETGNAILFFDEADAMFGKRTKVSDAHDRYANLEVSYLLQRMEEHDGVVIMASNLRENIDEAFTRRLRFVVEFPFPDEAGRRRIWETHFPAQAPVAPDVDCARLARELPVAGGSIRNIVLNAAFLAAADGGTIRPAHIAHGARREYEKMGKLWSAPALTGAPKGAE